MKTHLLFLFLFIPFFGISQISMNMSLLGTWDGSTSTCVSGICYNDIWGYVDGAGNEYAIMGTPEIVYFVDVTDPTNPTLKQSFTGTGRSLWRDLKSYGDYLYVIHDSNQTADGEGLWIFDMSALPSGNIVSVGTIETEFSRAHNIFIDEDNARLYVAGSDTNNNGLYIYSLANPAAPTLIGSPNLSVGMGGYVHDLFVRDNIAYCNSGYDGMFIVDLNDPTLPVGLEFISTGGYNHSSWMTDDDQYVIYASELPKGVPLHLVDVSDLSYGIRPVAEMKQPNLAPTHKDNTPHNPLIKGHYCYVSYYEDGVQVWNISNPNAPFLAGYYDMINNTTYNGTTGVWGVYPYLPSGNIIASNVSNGLYILKQDYLLPAELTEFTARAVNNKHIQLNWGTLTETNSKEFQIERSTDGINFEYWATVPANGNSNTPLNYKALDVDPYPSISYYRLKILDLDGIFRYSEIRPVKIVVEIDFTIYPNPVSNDGKEITISMSDQTTDPDIKVEIFNSAGQLVFNDILILDKQKASFNIQKLSPGFYFTRIKHSNFTHTESLSILRK